ncbi:MAG: hypothetical protein AAF533_11560 [Acidobacteriota bacterium]
MLRFQASPLRLVPTVGLLVLGLLAPRDTSASSVDAMLSLGSSCHQEAADLLRSCTRFELEDIRSFDSGSVRAVAGRVVGDRPLAVLFLAGFQRPDIPDGYYVLVGVGAADIWDLDPPPPSYRVALPAKLVPLDRRGETVLLPGTWGSGGEPGFGLGGTGTRVKVEFDPTCIVTIDDLF